jgi:hypothetical protein
LLITPIKRDIQAATINMIINAISYIRVKPKIIIFSNKNEIKEHYYYMIEKGKLGYSIDNEKYELQKHSGIGTSALIKNSKKICFLLTIERCYLYKLPIERYKIIVEEFFNR